MVSATLHNAETLKVQAQGCGTCTLGVAAALP